jgi:hypothetical protein
MSFACLLTVVSVIVTAQTPHLNENTGYVVASPAISLILWDDDWNANNPVSRNQLKKFIESLVENAYLGGASQYHVGPASVGGVYATGLADRVCGPVRAPSSVSSREIYDWLIRALLRLNGSEIRPWCTLQVRRSTAIEILVPMPVAAVRRYCAPR